MDVSPTLRMDDHFKSSDLFDLVSCSDYDFSSNSLGTDFTGLDDIVGRTVNNNNVTVGDVLNSPGWGYTPYTDPNLHQTTTLSPIDKEKDSSDKMWGGGGTTEKVINRATGNTIFITYAASDSTMVPPDSSDAPHNPSPPMTDNSSLDLFHSMLSEKPFDPLVSHNHRSPASDCVSYASAGSGYSDSGFSTSMDETASPSGQPTDAVDFDRLVDSAVGQMYSPGSGLPTVDDPSVLDAGTFLTTGVGGTVTYLAPVSQSDPSSILEGALRGTVRRPGGITTTTIPTKIESKTLTLMSNMSPLPPLTTAFKAEQLGLPPSQPQISSSNSVYVPATYEYATSSDDFSNLDNSFTKLSTASSSTKIESSKQQKKRKYTKRGTGEEPTSKGRLLHFCPVCNKGFKDKYSVNVHLRTHTGEKPFNCELCGKSFRQKAHLAKHIQIHSAQKPPGTKR